MRRSNFALRLQPSLLEEARKLAEAEGVALKPIDQRGGGGETLGTPDGGLLHRASCACGFPEGAESPQAGRCW